jgi:hypothetical protein
MEVGVPRSATVDDLFASWRDALHRLHETNYPDLAFETALGACEDARVRYRTALHARLASASGSQVNADLVVR